MKKLSGADWVREFPGSSSTADLSMQFCPGVERFIKALKKAGARVNISATLRPPERAYLMHWAWMLSNKKVTPEKSLPIAASLSNGTTRPMRKVSLLPKIW